jgi:hypothetical protein
VGPTCQPPSFLVSPPPAAPHASAGEASMVGELEGCGVDGCACTLLSHRTSFADGHACSLSGHRASFADAPPSTRRAELCHKPPPTLSSAKGTHSAGGYASADGGRVSQAPPKTCSRVRRNSAAGQDGAGQQRLPLPGCPFHSDGDLAASDGRTRAGTPPVRGWRMVRMAVARRVLLPL